MKELNEVWPIFGLVLTTPRLILRPITDADIPPAVDAARSGIYEPGMNPFSTAWAELPKAELGASMAQRFWRARAEATPASWKLLLGVWQERDFVGCQNLGARDFAVLKTVKTASWLTRSRQGEGLGKEMRAAAACYAFDWMHAEVSESEAMSWNAASLGVSRSLGYEPNGVERVSWDARREEIQRTRLTPGTFKRPDWRLQVTGHAAVADFLDISL
ncbi:GNAT family N-acetyltransferase [Arthrobacter sp. B1I2]|uniref:GNAT family N-acetyltransferase n=1 Tax=Arthrobacter sp. B1I2 TaxID=3042263 RepID=UPI0027873550|nr:GNAT family protein [Arthrobacter sp. B1I2]MDQ0730711.1 RimJ/RimL family protein N-acetyltransferase [Arthrobacter sp. B1I2]